MTEVGSGLRSLEGKGVAPYATEAARLIARISSMLDLRAFRLAGGTGLAWYLAHRTSDDLDFFTYVPGAFDRAGQEQLAAALNPFAVAETVDISSPQTLHAMVQTAAGECGLSFFEVRSAVWVDPPERVREGFAVASLRDVGAMKLLAVTGRCTKKDFYDLVALERHGVTVPELYAHARRMHPALDDAMAREHVRRSLAYHADAESDPDPRTLIGTTWAEAKRVAIRAADQIARGADRAFDLPAVLREDGEEETVCIL